MGSKQTWKRKHLFLYLTCGLILIFIFTGCADFRHIYSYKESHNEKHLAKAVKLMRKGYYKASIAEIQRVMMLFPNSLENQGLFLMGLVYMHPENPERDYQKSLGCFTTLESNGKFVKSHIKTETLIYQNLLKERIDRNKEIKELKHKIESLETEIREDEKNTAKLQNQQKDLHTMIKKLKDQIKDLKAIDLGIEEKKRKSLKKQTGKL